MTKSSKESISPDPVQRVECQIKPPLFLKIMAVLFFILFSVWLCLHRYEYRLLNLGEKDVKTYNAVRFDRWTNKVEVYVTLGKAERIEDVEKLKTGWTDFAKRSLLLTGLTYASSSENTTKDLD